MKSMRSRRLVVTSVVSLAIGFPLFVPATGSGDSVSKTKEEEKEELVVLSPFCVSTGNLGATPGGAQDIAFFRMGAGRGEIPHPDTITAEGLFSEHDLPLEVKKDDGSLFVVQTAATAARFEVVPHVRYLAQLGLSSSLRAETWKPEPLNLVAVVDKSGSMSGEPLSLVRASLLSALGHMHDGDQISIVLYGDTSHVHLEPTTITASTRGRIARRIKAIESAGSTSMEAGLTLGYEVARASRKDFSGNTRVMLFTDERPNVGNTAAEGFMGMAEAASREGIGLTTIGVGVQFGAELATRISSVRGGNLFFFEDGAAMKKTFASDFDTMVTELAHDFSVRIAPAPGLRLAGVFGVPGEMLHWDGDTLVLDVASIFLSRRKGAIYFALAPAAPDQDLPARTMTPGDVVARVDLAYTSAHGAERATGFEACRLLAGPDVQVGLIRGASLVDEYLTLKKLATAHRIDNDQETAFRLAHGLLRRLAASGDAALVDEVRLVGEIHNTLAFLSGHVGEVQPAPGAQTASPLVGVWRHAATTTTGGIDEFFVIWPNAVVEHVTVDRTTHSSRREENLALDGKLPRRLRGTLPLGDADHERLGAMRYALRGDELTLEIERWNDAPASFRLVRCAFAELEPGGGGDDTRPEVDEITGLPKTPGTRDTTVSTVGDGHALAH